MTQPPPSSDYDEATQQFMRRFVQIVDDRDHERNGCKMEDYARELFVSRDLSAIYERGNVV